MNDIPFLDSNDLIFYPGSGKDIIPLLIPAFRNKGDSPRTFIFVDYDPNVFSLFSSLDSSNSTLEEWRSLNPKYSSFFDSLQLESIEIEHIKKTSTFDIPRLILLLKITTQKGKVYRSELQLFQTDVDTYFSKCHLEIFNKHKINLILNIVQITNIEQHSNRFFGYEKFNQYLTVYPLVRDAEFAICDNNKALYRQNWKPDTDYTFNGWGVAGNTLNNFGSAVLYERRNPNENLLTESDPGDLEPIERRLKEIKFDY